MPKDRTVLHASRTLSVERVVLHQPPGAWSTSYEVASQRFVLPLRGATDFRLAGGLSLVLDSVTVLSLPVSLPYRMLLSPGHANESIVVSALGSAGVEPSQAQAWTLAPRAIWQLRRHWRRLARGEVAAGAPVHTDRLLVAALPPSVRPLAPESNASAAVQRAQRFMAARTEAMDGHRWVLSDVADAACCSPFHLARLFRSHTGVSLHGYRQRLRLARALHHLEQGERDLAGLAAVLGYSGQSHMGETFRSMLGVTPAQARDLLAA